MAGRVVRFAFRIEGGGAIAVRALSLVNAGPGSTLRVPAPRPWNVVVYVIDTLRADYVGAYGSALDTTPRIDAFAQSAVRFSRTIAQSSWTLP